MSSTILNILIQPVQDNLQRINPLFQKVVLESRGDKDQPMYMAIIHNQYPFNMLNIWFAIV